MRTAKCPPVTEGPHSSLICLENCPPKTKNTHTHTQHRGSCYKPDIKSELSQSVEKQDNVTHSSVHMSIPPLEVIFIIP